MEQGRKNTTVMRSGIGQNIKITVEELRGGVGSKI